MPRTSVDSQSDRRANTLRAQQPIANSQGVYRADIDGLRALAIIPVVLFHAFPSALPGGFVGVDIFFMISGFLISGILFRSLYNAEFSFFRFLIKTGAPTVSGLECCACIYAGVWLVCTLGG